MATSADFARLLQREAAGRGVPFRQTYHRFAAFTGLSRDAVDAAADGFRDPRVWSRRDGAWVIDDFLIPDWSWS